MARPLRVKQTAKTSDTIIPTTRPGTALTPHRGQRVNSLSAVLAYPKRKIRHRCKMRCIVEHLQRPSKSALQFSAASGRAARVSFVPYVSGGAHTAISGLQQLGAPPSAADNTQDLIDGAPTNSHAQQLRPGLVAQSARGAVLDEAMR